MKNLFLLPTEKPSRLFKFANELHLDTIPKDYYKKYNIYITSDEEIKEGDWIKWGEAIYKANKKYIPPFKKIILTTDQDLIKDGVQAIDDEFLEWFVKNPSCEYVEIKTRYLHSYKTGENFISFSKTPEFSSRNMQCIKIEPRYKIIIPQEEPKK
jgi:hypothetical protein